MLGAMRLFGLIIVSSLLGCAGAPEPAATPTASVAPAAQTASPAPASPAGASSALDLSTADKARTTLYEVLRRGDKEAFRRCVTKRILARQEAHFDEWYGVWKAAADRGAEPFKKVTVAQ